MAGLRSNRSFVRLFAGRLVTNAGDSLYAIASMWLVYQLTGSPAYTGLAGFLLFGVQPLQFLAGPLVDRWSLRRVLVGTQLVQAVGVLVVPLAALTGHLTVWVVLAVIPVLALVNQFVYPAQNAALPRIVDDENLVRANSLFSLAYQGVDVAFNAAGGLLVAAVGAVALYAVDAGTFAVALVLFVGVTVPAVSDSADDADAEGVVQDSAGDDPTADSSGYLADLAEGFGYVRGSAVLGIVLGGVVVNFAFGMAVAVLPAYAATLGGAGAFGLLMAAMSAGTLAGALGASAVEDRPVGSTVIVAWTATAALWAGALAVPGLWSTVGLVFAAFVPAGTTNVLSSSMLQSAVDEGLLARVTSVRSSVSTAMMPVGSLLGGVAAGVAGPVAVLSGMVVGSAFLAAYFLARPRLRSLPPVAEADEAVLGLSTPSSAGGRGDDPGRSDQSAGGGDTGSPTGGD